MRLQASGCYYHPGRLAVAVCAKCGVGICRDCAVKNAQGTIICYKCGNEELRQEQKGYRKWLKERGGHFSKGTDFIVPGIIGILLVALGIFGCLFESSRNANFHMGVVDYMALGAVSYILFSIPFCYIVLDDLFAWKYRTSSQRQDKLFIKVMISFMLGWIAFPFILIRFIIRRKILKNKNRE